MNTGRQRKALSLYRLAFDDVVSDLRKAKSADTSERASETPETRPTKGRKGLGRKGYRSVPHAPLVAPTGARRRGRYSGARPAAGSTSR